MLATTLPRVKLSQAAELDAHHKLLRVSMCREARTDGTSAIESAVESCVHAALFEWDSQRQKALLEAAAYGRPLCR